MPAVLHGTKEPSTTASLISLGPAGPFPDASLSRVLERRWLHYAFLTRDLRSGLVANIAHLGPAHEDPARRARCTSILLLYHEGEGWIASQFNGATRTPFWSSFRQPHAFAEERPFEIASTAGAPWVKLNLARSSRPCTSQCAPFAGNQHLRWQSESGVQARGDWGFGKRVLRNRAAVGYHERVRGYWGWPELGSWVFGFANDARGQHGEAPSYAAVFTLINPPKPDHAATASVMLWKDGRLRRHFPRRGVSVAVSGFLDPKRVRQVPALANLLGVPPMQPIPRRLVISAQMGDDRLLLDFEAEAAARVVIPCETSLRPFSVHEVIGTCRLEGKLNRKPFGFETKGIVEFAGGAGGD